MSTYTASKIATARNEHKCSRCDKAIAKGTRYLRYQLDQQFSSALHLTCAELRSENGSLAYDCAALRTHFGVAQRSAYPSLEGGPLDPEQPEVAPVTASEDMEADDYNWSRGDHRSERDCAMDEAGVSDRMFL